MSEIGKKPMAVIKGAMADGIVMPDEAIAIGNAMVADDGKVDAHGAMLMFRHLHDLQSKTEFVLDEDRARLSDIAKLGIKQLFERQYNGLLCTKPGEKTACAGKKYSLLFDSVAMEGSSVSFAYFSHKFQRYYQLTVDNERRENFYTRLSLKSGSVVYEPFSIGNIEWFHSVLLPTQKAGIVKHAVQREKLVALVDALEKGIYTKGNHRNTPAKLKGYSKKKSKRSDQNKIADTYYKSLAKRVPHSMFKIHGVTIRVRGEIAREIKEKIREAFRAFHPNELKAIGLLGFNIFDDRKLKNFVRSKLPGDPKRVHSTSTAFVYVSMPREVFLSTYRYKNIVTLRHEIGHCLDNVYGKPSGKEY